MCFNIYIIKSIIIISQVIRDGITKIYHCGTHWCIADLMSKPMRDISQFAFLLSFTIVLDDIGFAKQSTQKGNLIMNSQQLTGTQLSKYLTLF